MDDRKNYVSPEIKISNLSELPSELPANKVEDLATSLRMDKWELKFNELSNSIKKIFEEIIKRKGEESIKLDEALSKYKIVYDDNNATFVLKISLETNGIKIYNTYGGDEKIYSLFKGPDDEWYYYFNSGKKGEEMDYNAMNGIIEFMIKKLDEKDLKLKLEPKEPQKTKEKKE